MTNHPFDFEEEADNEGSLECEHVLVSRDTQYPTEDGWEQRVTCLGCAVSWIDVRSYGGPVTKHFS